MDGQGSESTLAMTDFPAIALTDQVYLQPTGWCAPDYANLDGWRQIAGLPIWASKVRIIVRSYKGRATDQVFQVSEMAAFLDGADRPDVVHQWSNLTSPRAPWNLQKKQLSFHQTQLMGILNATPDSFSDGGDHFDPASALQAAREMQSAGANILDIGGESTRPGAKVVWEGEEIDRTMPIVLGAQALGIPISLDTRKTAVMEEGLNAGADIINDVSALTFDENALALMADKTCPVILMHSQGDPQSMQDAPHYEDVVLDVYDGLAARIQACLDGGIDAARIAIDPGIGFGKTLQHNLALIQNLAIFHGLGCPILLGVSRKRFIGALSNVETERDRVPGSLTAAMIGMQQGVHILRVHDVTQTRQMLDVWRGFADAQQLPPAI